jgi:hypothetical protein
MGQFDACVDAIELLCKHSHLCLGINLSAQSVGDGLWWGQCCMPRPCARIARGGW